MNKSELIRAVAEENKCTLEDVRSIVNTTFKIIRERIIDGDKVSLSAFGTFHLKTRAQRPGFDAYEKKPIVIPEGKTIKFEPSTGFKDDVKEKYEVEIN